VTSVEGTPNAARRKLAARNRARTIPRSITERINRAG
jgi:hypothetical protein